MALDTFDFDLLKIEDGIPGVLEHNSLVNVVEALTETVIKMQKALLFAIDLIAKEPVATKQWVSFDCMFLNIDQVYWVYGSIMQEDVPHVLLAKWVQTPLDGLCFQDKRGQCVYDVTNVRLYDPSDPDMSLAPEVLILNK